MACAVILVSPQKVQAPNLPLQELEILDIILIQENSLQANSGLLWGIKKQLWEVTDKYGLEYNLLYNLAVCESGLIHENRWGDKGLSYGLFQWQKKSWDLYNKKFGLNLDRYKLEDQTEITAKVLAEGGEHNWRRCWRKIQGRPAE